MDALSAPPTASTSSSMHFFAAYCTYGYWQERLPGPSAVGKRTALLEPPSNKLLKVSVASAPTLALDLLAHVA
eukprot:scaffold80653_cov32-Tisochrysis_lutea.AAC.4